MGISRFGLSAFTGMALLGLAVGTPAARAETVLTYSPWTPRAYVLNDVIYAWMDEVAKVTEGRVRIEPLGAAVGKPKDQADVVRDGLADVSYIVVGYTPGRYPLLDLMSLPMLSDDESALAPAFAEVYEKHMAGVNKFEGAHALSVFTMAGAQLAGKKPATSADQLSGMKLYISNQPTSKALEALGAVPVSSTIAELFSMATTGVIDGAVLSYEYVFAAGLQDALTTLTAVPGGLGQAGAALLVNEAKWNSISEADRAAITKISGVKLAADAGRVLADANIKAKDQLAAKGSKIETASPELVSALQSEVDKMIDDWKKKSQSAGLQNADEVINELRASIKEVK